MSSTKRKNNSTTRTTSKKAKLAADANAIHAETVERILSDTSNFDLPEGSIATRDTIIKLAEYARSLEEEIDMMKPKEKSAEALADEAEKLASAACRGIKKQMTWKSTCKEGRARWVYDGVCQDPNVFGVLMGLDEPPNFKTKKLSSVDFENLIGRCTASARYSSLCLTSEVNIHWKAGDGTFKFSGSYGI